MQLQLESRLLYLLDIIQYNKELYYLYKYMAEIIEGSALTPPQRVVDIFEEDRNELIRRVPRGLDDLEDRECLVQDTFFGVYRRVSRPDFQFQIDKPDGEDNARRYIHVALKHRAVDKLRKKQRIKASEGIIVDIDPSDLPGSQIANAAPSADEEALLAEEEALRGEKEAELLKLLKAYGLTEVQQQAIILFCLEGFSQKEIAEITNSTPGTHFKIHEHLKM